MITLAPDMIAAIGNTPLVQLRKIVPAGSGRVVAKLESCNPTGSMKDRMARAAIEAAEVAGRLGPGSTVVEYTGGSTGVSLAFVCAVKGYRTEIVFSDAFSAEKGLTMRALGAHLTIVPSGGQGISEALIKRMIETAREISARDREVDDLYDSLFRALLTYMMENPQNIGHATHLLFIAKNLERVGDHATNIAEMVYYAATGEHMADRPGKSPKRKP